MDTTDKQQRHELQLSERLFTEQESLREREEEDTLIYIILYIHTQQKYYVI